MRKKKLKHMTGKWWISNKCERNLELEKRWKPKEKLKRERKTNNESDEIKEIQKWPYEFFITAEKQLYLFLFRLEPLW